MHDFWSEDLTATQNAPSKPFLTDEWDPTDERLWLRVLQVAKGRKREMTRVGPDGPRTIHAPNKGRGFRHWPNPKAIAWAVKQYNGYGGRWKGQGEESTKAASEAPVYGQILWLKHAVDSQQHSFEDVLHRRVRVGVEGDSGRDMLRAEQAGLFTERVNGIDVFAHSPDDAGPLIQYLKNGGIYGSPEFSSLLGYTSQQVEQYRRYLLASAEVPQPDGLNDFQKEALSRLKTGSIVTTEDDSSPYLWMSALEQKGFVHMIEASVERRESYWDLADVRVITAGLSDELTRKIEDLLKIPDPPDPTDLSWVKQANEVGRWVLANFRIKSPKTPRGQKALKDELERFQWFLNSGMWGYRSSIEDSWEKLKPQLADIVRYFSDEGGILVPREVDVGNITFINRAGLDQKALEKYSARLSQLFHGVRGWRAKALTGNLKIVFASAQDFNGTTKGKYKSAEDLLLVRTTPAVLKREAGYASLDYILIHELGHRYEHKVKDLPVDFDKPPWWTTRYSRADSMAGSESFAELFAIGHFGITGNWDAAILDRFEKVMA